MYRWQDDMNIDVIVNITWDNKDWKQNKCLNRTRQKFNKYIYFCMFAHIFNKYIYSCIFAHINCTNSGQYMAFCKRFRVTWTVSFIQGHGRRQLPKRLCGRYCDQHTSVSLFFLGTHLEYILLSLLWLVFAMEHEKMFPPPWVMVLSLLHNFTFPFT